MDTHTLFHHFQGIGADINDRHGYTFPDLFPQRVGYAQQGQESGDPARSHGGEALNWTSDVRGPGRGHEGKRPEGHSPE